MTNSLLQPCMQHSIEVRRHLHADPKLGCGNFLTKVLAQDVDKTGWIFSLERPFVLPNGRAYEALSLADLGDVVAFLASWYKAKDVVPGQVVLTYTSEGISQFIHSLALIAIGAIPAPVNWRMKPEITLLYFKKYEFSHLVVDQHDHTETVVAAARLSERPILSTLDVRPTTTPLSLELIGLRSYRDPGSIDELIMLCHSSGTTGVPKAVEFGHQQFFAGKRDRLLHFLECDRERMLSALPHSHSAGFSYLMTAVLLGIPTRVISNLVEPTLADEVLAFQPTIMAGFSQTYAALAGMKLSEGCIPSLQRSYNTGDTAHEAHVRALLRAAPNLRFYDGFGASELGMALFCSVSSRSGPVAGLRNVGAPVPFASVRILDELGRALPSGQVGYLAMRSPTITNGYYRDSNLTKLCRTAEGDWLTGDVGYLDSNGTFVHLDRAVDVIPTPRGPAYSLLLEEMVLRDLNVPDVTITGATLTPRTSQAVVAWIRVPPERAQQLSEQVLDLLARQLQLALGGPVPVAIVNASPEGPTATGATGKALKRQLRDDFWPTLRAWDEGRTDLVCYAARRNFPLP